MTATHDFRSRLEALLGETNTITRAAAALGCHRRTVHRWLDPDDPAPVPDWAVRHVEDIETVSALAQVKGVDPVDVLPPEWGGMPF